LQTLLDNYLTGEIFYSKGRRHIWKCGKVNLSIYPGPVKRIFQDSILLKEICHGRRRRRKPENKIDLSGL